MQALARTDIAFAMGVYDFLTLINLRERQRTPDQASAGLDYGEVAAPLAKFSRLADRWRKETGHMSSLDDICEHEAYRQIVAMGYVAVPFILDDMTRLYAQWFDALFEITGEDPVTDDENGNIITMTGSWLKWGQENGVMLDGRNP